MEKSSGMEEGNRGKSPCNFIYPPSHVNLCTHSPLPNIQYQYLLFNMWRFPSKCIATTEKKPDPIFKSVKFGSCVSFSCLCVLLRLGKIV